MDDLDVFTPTRRGEAELLHETTLGPDDLALLLRFDGSLTWGEVRAALPPASHAAAQRRLAHLLLRGLLERAELDAFAWNLQADAQRLAASGVSPAPSGLSSLRRPGFRARIALKRQVREARQSPAHVVLVEDDPMLAHFVKTFLTLEGFQVRVAGDRKEIVEQVRQPPRPDLFLLDVDLPDTDGFAVLRGIRRHPLLREVPAIMLTGEGTREAVIRGLAEGADGYITKPFDPENLVHAVQSVLGAAPAPAHEPCPALWSNRDALDRRVAA